jgi:hypothetical protein
MMSSAMRLATIKVGQNFTQVADSDCAGTFSEKMEHTANIRRHA